MMASASMQFGPDWIKKLASGDRPQSRESNHSNPTSANASGPSSASTFDAVHLNGPSLGQQQQPQHGGRPLSYSSVAGNGQGRPRSAAQQQHQQASSGGQGSGSGGAGNGDALVASADQNPFRYDFDLMLSLFKDVKVPIDFDAHTAITSFESLPFMINVPVSSEEKQIRAFPSWNPDAPARRTQQQQQQGGQVSGAQQQQASQHSGATTLSGTMTPSASSTSSSSFAGAGGLHAPGSAMKSYRDPFSNARSGGSTYDANRRFPYNQHTSPPAKDNGSRLPTRNGFSRPSGGGHHTTNTSSPFGTTGHHHGGSTVADDDPFNASHHQQQKKRQALNGASSWRSPSDTESFNRLEHHQHSVNRGGSSSPYVAAKDVMEQENKPRFDTSVLSSELAATTRNNHLKNNDASSSRQPHHHHQQQQQQHQHQHQQQQQQQPQDEDELVSAFHQRLRLDEDHQQAQQHHRQQQPQGSVQYDEFRHFDVTPQEQQQQQHQQHQQKQQQQHQQQLQQADVYQQHQQERDNAVHYYQHPQQQDTQQQQQQQQFNDTFHQRRQQNEQTEAWSYKDPAGNIQGPFSSKEMFQWYEAGYFAPDLPICRSHVDTQFYALSLYCDVYRGEPFTQPPIDMNAILYPPPPQHQPHHQQPQQQPHQQHYQQHQLISSLPPQLALQHEPNQVVVEEEQQDKEKENEDEKKGEEQKAEERMSASLTLASRTASPDRRTTLTTTTTPMVTMVHKEPTSTTTSSGFGRPFVSSNSNASIKTKPMALPAAQQPPQALPPPQPTLPQGQTVPARPSTTELKPAVVVVVPKQPERPAPTIADFMAMSSESIASSAAISAGAGASSPWTNATKVQAPTLLEIQKEQSKAASLAQQTRAQQQQQQNMLQSAYAQAAADSLASANEPDLIARSGWARVAAKGVTSTPSSLVSSTGPSLAALPGHHPPLTSVASATIMKARGPSFGQPAKQQDVSRPLSASTIPDPVTPNVAAAAASSSLKRETHNESPKPPSHEFVRWARTQLKNVMNVNVDEFVALLLTIDDPAMASEMISETAGTSDRLDVQKFTAEFLRRRESEAAGAASFLIRTLKAKPAPQHNEQFVTVGRKQRKKKD